jgi:uncharacterized DUF497 family protein
MSIEYEPIKYATNIARHGVPLRFAAALFEGPVIEWSEEQPAPTGKDSRWLALGSICGRVFVCIFTWQGKARRIILLRKATQAESNVYFENADLENCGNQGC